MLRSDELCARMCIVSPEHHLLRRQQAREIVVDYLVLRTSYHHYSKSSSVPAAYSPQEVNNGCMDPYISKPLQMHRSLNYSCNHVFLTEAVSAGTITLVLYLTLHQSAGLTVVCMSHKKVSTTRTPSRSTSTLQQTCEAPQYSLVTSAPSAKAIILQQLRFLRRIYSFTPSLIFLLHIIVSKCAV